jgi:hypothetical protein
VRGDIHLRMCKSKEKPGSSELFSALATSANTDHPTTGGVTYSLRLETPGQAIGLARAGWMGKMACSSEMIATFNHHHSIGIIRVT